MTVAITLQGALVDEVVDGDFDEVIEKLNHAGAIGKPYVIMENINGKRTMVNLGRILTAHEEDD